MAKDLLEAFRSATLLGAERPAVITPGRTLSYGDLDQRSGQWAAQMQGHAAAQIGARVAVALPSGIESVIATWAIIKSGLVLVPIDLQWPPQRIARVLEEAEPVLWIGDSPRPAFAEGLTAFTPAQLDQHKATFQPRELSPERLLAILFTSGSSGEPKGVALDQDCLWHAATNYHHALEFTPNDRVSWTAPFAYGAAIGVILPTLTAGAALVPWHPNERPLAECVEWLSTARVSVIMIVTSLFRTISTHLPDGENLPLVRLIKIGGEPAHPDDAELFARRFHPDCTLINGLGITEIGANVCFYRWQRGTPIPPPTLPLGPAADGIELLIADENGAALPPGSEGEILVRSRWMARGYWTKSGIKRERFLPLPGDTTPTYRTGDLGRLLPDGSLQHLGSLSTRLKVRGFRVDAIEVESVLRTLAGVSEAAVTVRSVSGTPKLIAWITGPEAHNWTVTRIRKALRSQLADYMLPGLVCPLPELPKSINGKLDRAALSDRSLELRATAHPIEDPLERQISKIWERVLGIRGIGRSDIFFDLGGDSLAAIALLDQIERRLGVDLPMLHISHCPTIELMARCIQSETTPSPAAILLEAGHGEETVFCLPAGGGEVSSLFELARELAPIGSVYGLQLFGFDGATQPATSVEEAAERLLPEVLRVRPTGPFHFVGVSFGGRVAFELARLLRNRGEHVATLALLDTFGPGVPRIHANLPIFQRWRARWILYAAEGPKLHPNRTIFRKLWRRLREVTRLLRADRWLRHRLPVSELPRELRPFFGYRIARRASLSHAPAPLDVPMDLYIPEQSFRVPYFGLTDDRGWQPFAAAGLNIIHATGHHATMFRTPHVEALATHIAGQIRARESSSSSGNKSIVAQTQAQWEELADWWDAQVGESGESLAARALAPIVDQLLDATAGAHVLELACGNGWYARRLAARGVQVTATDFSDRFLQRARERGGTTASHITYTRLNTALKEDWACIPDRVMDAAVCNMGVMDMADISVLFSELARVLKAGSPFVFSIISPESPDLSGTAAGQTLSWIGIPGQPTRHTVFHRSVEQIAAIAQASNFLTERMERYNNGKEEFLVIRMCRPANAAA